MKNLKNIKQDMRKRGKNQEKNTYIGKET